MNRFLFLGAAALGPLMVCAAPASADSFCSTPDVYANRYTVRVGYGSGDRCPDYGRSPDHGRGRYDDRRYPGRDDGHRRVDDYRHESWSTFRVVYRPSCQGAWQHHGSFGCREDADRVARSLCRGGAEAFVRCD
jgi:hypothetical protein